MPKINEFTCAVWLTLAPPVIFWGIVFPGINENLQFWVLFSLVAIEITGSSLWLKIIVFYLFRQIIKKHHQQPLTNGESADNLPREKTTVWRQISERYQTTNRQFCLLLAVTGVIALMTCLLLIWHIDQQRQRYRAFGPFQQIAIEPPKYKIDECKSLKLNLDRIAKDKLNNAHIEVRTGPVYFCAPCSSSQTVYDLGSDLICYDKKTPFPGFNRGKAYQIYIRTKDDHILCSAEIYVADYWFNELYFYEITSFSIPLGTLITGILLVLLCLTGIYRFGFGSKKQSPISRG